MLPSEARLTRRGALLGAASLAALPCFTSGCTRHRPHITTASENLLDETLALEQTLLASYEAALGLVSRRTPLAQTIMLIRAEHLAHRGALLTAGAKEAPLPSSTPAPAALGPGGPRVALATAENAAATIRVDACARAPRELAPLLASLAASETAHAALLREAR
ncbi:MAG: hypothetical protein ACJ735_15365 [Actinomycetes bacterium]